MTIEIGDVRSNAGINQQHFIIHMKTRNRQFRNGIVICDFMLSDSDSFHNTKRVMIVEQNGMNKNVQSFVTNAILNEMMTFAHHDRQKRQFAILLIVSLP